MADILGSGIPPETASLLAKVSTPLLLVSDSGEIKSINPSATELLGLSADTVTGQNWAGTDAQLTLIHWKMHWQTLTNGEVIEYDTDVMTKDQFLLSVSVRITQYSPQLALVELTDNITRDAASMQLETLGEAVRAGTFFYNFVSDQLWVSGSARALLGIPATDNQEEIIRFFQEELSSEDWAHLRDLYCQRKAEAGNIYYAFRMTPFNEEVNLLLEAQSAGNALHVTHLFGSIRQEVKTNYAVAGEITEELARFSIDEALEMIFWTKPNGKISYVNQSVANKLGYSRDQLTKGEVTLIAPYFDETYRAAFWNKLREEKSFSAEFDIFNTNGDAVPISAEVNYINIDGKEYACSFCRDLTRVKKRNTLIELSQSALDFTSDCVIWLEEDFSIRYVNQKIADLLGGDTESWLGKSYRAIYPLLSEEVIRAGKTEDVFVTDESGKQVDFEVRCDAVSTKDDNYYVLFGRDVSARVKRERSLKEAYEKIRVLKERTEQENLSLREEVNTNYNVNNIITVSPKYQKILQQINQVAEVDTTVLITGETGTGKELLARAIHRVSDREDRPLVKVNCAALPESLIESELFGHEKGAFTGAVNQKKGRFEMADGGSIFLDEVGEMPLELQAKLLRVLQEGEFERLGGTETISVDVRLIAATNRNLKEMVNQGRFRSDLYYRLNVFPIVNLALRERPEDIPVLVEHFTKKYARQQGKAITEISSADLQKLQRYDFPGNIRELENLIERAVVLCRSSVLKIPLENKVKRRKANSRQPILPFEEMQRQHIIRALKATGGRITGPEGAGKLLGLNDRTLMSKMRKMNIQKREYLV